MTGDELEALRRRGREALARAASLRDAAEHARRCGSPAQGAALEGPDLPPPRGGALGARC